MRPDGDDIVQKVEELLDKRNSLESIANNGRQYIEKYHSHIIVVTIFITWKKLDEYNIM